MRLCLTAVCLGQLGVSLGAQAPSRPVSARAADVVAGKPGDPLPRARPESVGMSSQRLAEIATVLNADIAANRLPGAVLAIGADVGVRNGLRRPERVALLEEEARLRER